MYTSRRRACLAHACALARRFMQQWSSARALNFMFMFSAATIFSHCPPVEYANHHGICACKPSLTCQPPSILVKPALAVSDN